MATVKDVTIKFNAETTDLNKVSDAFDKVNKEINDQNKALDTNKQKHIESGQAATKAVKDTDEGFKKFNDTLLDVGRSLGIAFGVAEIINFGKESIKAFQDLEKNTNLLKFALVNVGNEGDRALKKLIDQANKLRGTTIFSDDSIIKAQAQLVQFGLTSDQVEKLIPQIIDLASATGKDLGSATDLAIQGINGMGRQFRPLGIVIKDTGDKTQNLNNLTQDLTKFQGAAAVALNTSAGAAANAANRIDDLKKSLGSKIAPFFQNLEESVLTQVEGATTGLAKLFDFVALKLGGVNARVKEAQQASADAKAKFNEEDDKSTKDANTKSLGLTQAGIDAKKAAEKKASDDRKAAQKSEFDELKKQREDFTAEISAKEFDFSAAGKELLDQEVTDHDKAQKQKTENIKTQLEIQKEAELQAKEDKQKEAELDIEFTKTLVNGLFEYQNQLDQAKLDEDERNAQTEIENVQKLVDNKVINEDEGAKRIKKINDTLNDEKKKAAIEQAKRDKSQALFDIAISTAVGIAKASPNLVLQILLAAIGATQAAFVAAKPLPFAKGVIDLKGGQKGKDSIPAMLMPEESVMTAEETRRHKNLFMAIRNDKFEDFINKKYIEPQMNLNTEKINSLFTPAILESARINNIDEYALGRVLSRNKEVEIKNADYLAAKIASEISSKSRNTKRLWSE